MLFHTDLDKWPTHKWDNFWSGACAWTKTVPLSVTLVGQCSHAIFKSSVVFVAVSKWLAVHCKTPPHADAHYSGQAEASVDAISGIAESQWDSTHSNSKREPKHDGCHYWLVQGSFKVWAVGKDIETLNSYVLVCYSVTVPCDSHELAARAIAQLKRNHWSFPPQVCQVYGHTTGRQWWLLFSY